MTLELGRLAIQRSGVFTELPGLLRELGADVSEVFAGSAVDPGSLRPDARLPFRAIVQILHRAAHHTGCAHLGLLLGQRFTLAHHGAVGRVMKHAPTLHEALIEFVTWQPGYSSGAVVYLNRVADEVALGYGTLDQTSPGATQLYDCVISIGIRMLQEMTGGQARPREIHFSRRRPDDLATYVRLLNVPLRFREPRNCLILDASALTIRLPGADHEARLRALGDIQSAMRDALDLTSTRVKHALRSLMTAGRTSMPATAEVLGVHPRTLRRRLADEGLTFEALRDHVRFAVARELLEMTDLPIGDISQAVSLASPGNFTDAFRRWTGKSPSEWRQACAGREAEELDPGSQG